MKPHAQNAELQSRVVESSLEINLAFGETAAELRQAGTMLPINDVWIAAVAQTIGATVVAKDKHFKHVKNLAVVDWTLHSA